ncbi:FecR domain-containing protein [Massilia aurea]|uniref:FecR domain-containing protein n=1 Tax=Massilia aurea TaxID=373040 RepID=UPI003462D619
MPARAQLVRTAGDAPLDPRVAREAAHWMMRMHPSAQPDDNERQACLRWRASHAQHELAWQRAQQLDKTFGIIPAELGNATLGRPPARPRRETVKKIFLLLTLAPASMLAYQQLPVAAWRAAHRTSTAERRSVQLADGTRVHMNTNTAFDVDYNHVERLLILHEGEVLIATAPDTRAAARPFRVETADGFIRAIGTRFTVKRIAAWSDVAVLEGAVEAQARNDAQHKRILTAEHQMRFSADGLAEMQALAAYGAAWVDGILVADNGRLADFSAELSRYRRGWLECDPAVAGLRISGTFQLDDTDRVLRALAHTLPVRVVYRTRYWATIVPA